MKMLTHLLFFLAALSVSVSAQKVTDEFAAMSIRGETVTIKQTQGAWIFAPDEPLKVTVLKQKRTDNQTTVTAWIKTSDVEATVKIEGKIMLVFTNSEDGLELSSIEDTGLSYKQIDVAAPVTVPRSQPMPNVRSVLIATGTNVIGGRGSSIWSFTVSGGLDRLRGWFSGPNGGIQGLVMSVNEYENWKKGGTSFKFLDTGKQVVGSVDIKLRDGSYVFVAFNPNLLSSQSVRVELVLE